MYPALLTLMHTTWLPAVDWTDSPADLNGLIRVGERQNVVSARVPSGSTQVLHRSNVLLFLHTGFSVRVMWCTWNSAKELLYLPGYQITLHMTVTFIIFNFQKIPIQNVFNFVHNFKVIPIFQIMNYNKLPNLHSGKYCILYCNNRVRFMVCLVVTTL